ncbi:PTS sugar transporter subunit IIA [Clostridium sp. Cult2]|uniref:PTS sugar transporter subunit IIA n=1 Tax=Clostridium sp. Cult2 TaxID=2079003 RepID=UPI001F39CFBD|nr:PTS sugar transporter subunit IIA [Clostridium sp. Cult2]MCF6464945.1 transcriptional regulator [Clostridium sp. Cult2]
MLSKYLQDNINFMDGIFSWEESIELGARPLLEKGYITPKYIKDIITNINKNGSYIVIVPGIAMPHARNEGGVIKTGISFLKLKNHTVFPDDKKVNILLTLAAKDNSEHLELLSNLSSILIDEEIRERFKDADTKEEVISLIKMVE